MNYLEKQLTICFYFFKRPINLDPKRNLDPANPEMYPSMMSMIYNMLIDTKCLEIGELDILAFSKQCNNLMILRGHFLLS